MATPTLWQRMREAVDAEEEVLFTVEEARELLDEHARALAIEDAARATLDETLDETDTRERLQDELERKPGKKTKRRAA